jgi:hypothetical protein
VATAYCTYHEYRISLGMAFVAGIIMGLADATVEAWSAKAYVWAFVLGFYALLIAYEFIVMQTPPHPLLQALLFVIAAPMGILSGHHITLLAVRAALGELPTSLPLSPLTPNIYVSLDEYLLLTGVMLAIYAALVVLANAESCD